MRGDPKDYHRERCILSEVFKDYYGKGMEKMPASQIHSTRYAGIISYTFLNPFEGLILRYTVIFAVLIECLDFEDSLL